MFDIQNRVSTSDDHVKFMAISSLEKYCVLWNQEQMNCTVCSVYAHSKYILNKKYFDSVYSNTFNISNKRTVLFVFFFH